MVSLRPGSGTATGRVWEIADEITARGRGLAKRAEVLRRYVAEGGNAKTASTQYQHWRAEHAEAARGTTLRVNVQVKEGGRIVLPAELRAALGVSEGDTLRAELSDGELRLMSRQNAIRRAQALVRRHIPRGTSLVEQLLEDRRSEVRRDSEE